LGHLVHEIKLVASPLEGFPGKVASFGEMKEDIPQSLEVITFGNFFIFGTLDGRISQASWRQFIKFLLLILIFVALILEELGSTAEIRDVNLILISSSSNIKILWLNIIMNYMMRMQKLNPCQHLIKHHQLSFQSEFIVTLGKDFHQRQPQLFSDHNVIVVL